MQRLVQGLQRGGKSKGRKSWKRGKRRKGILIKHLGGGSLGGLKFCGRGFEETVEKAGKDLPKVGKARGERLGSGGTGERGILIKRLGGGSSGFFEEKVQKGGAFLRMWFRPRMQRFAQGLQQEVGQARGERFGSGGRGERGGSL